MKVNTTNLPGCKECAIRATALFGELETKHLDRARALRSAQVVYDAGEYLYHEGDVPEKAYTLYKGWVVLFKDMQNGDRQILRFALPGDFLCYKVGKHKVMDHSAIAASEATLCAFPIDRFRETIAELPDLAFAISSITERATQRCHTVLTTIASHPAETKIAFLLLSLFIRELALHPVNTECVPFPITQEDIADALGLTSIHVNRVLQVLRKDGLIECKNRCLRVYDIIALADRAKISLPEIEHLMLGVK
ncbi:MAG: Crp/Fnr family transcriptional regulator [Gammaproteobacteria bacterium]|nr:Crp/Fnr family transcriptional regulator [Gammaproteobacteria bacterium]